MKLAHALDLRVFVKEGEDTAAVRDGLRRLLPEDAEKEGIAIEEQAAEGFEERRILILKAALRKERHLRAALARILGLLDAGERELLWSQVDSRLDDSLRFFIRLDKEELLAGRGRVTESGNCFHLAITMAAYPARKEIARELVRRMLSL